MRRMGRTALAAVVLASTLATARPARAEFWEEAGWGVLSVLTNAVYMPAKITYALLGGLTGGLAFGLTGGDMDTAQAIWTASMGGTYAVTPGMLQGEQPIVFAGSPSDAKTADAGDNGSLQEQELGGSSGS